MNPHRMLGMLAVIVILASSLGCASIYNIDTSQMRVLSVAELARTPDGGEQEVGKLMQGGQPVVFLFRKGEAVPVQLRVVLPMAELQAGANSLVFNRDTYLLVSASKLQLSPDGQRWADLSNFRAVKELFGSERGGSFTFGFGVSKEHPPQISIGVGTK